MDIDIHYPYGIPFYADIKMIRVYFMNNDQDFFCIYFRLFLDLFLFFWLIYFMYEFYFYRFCSYLG